MKKTLKVRKPYGRPVLTRGPKLSDVVAGGLSGGGDDN